MPGAFEVVVAYLKAKNNLPTTHFQIAQDTGLARGAVANLLYNSRRDYFVACDIHVPEQLIRKTRKHWSLKDINIVPAKKHNRRPLSDRVNDIAKRMRDGQSNSQIANDLKMSYQYVGHIRLRLVTIPKLEAQVEQLQQELENARSNKA